MPLESPKLDDLRFDRVVEEMKRRIPVYAPEWTDHNDSDPGIALIQLFAYLTEQIGYRLNRVPEKNHVELLKILGVRLEAAQAARTRLALLLSSPSSLVGYPLAKGAKARARTGSPPPVFETDEGIDVVPAEPVVFVTTKNPYLDDVLRTDVGRESPETLPDVPSRDNEWLSVVWDGETPKPIDMPLEPVRLKRPEHAYLWIGLDANLALSAGFRTARVSLHVQLDDDEQPDVRATQTCTQDDVPGEPAPQVDWLFYFDADAGAMRRMPGRIEDTTAQLTRSGFLRFTVPLTVGAIPSFADMRPPHAPAPLEACLALNEGMLSGLEGAGSISTLTIDRYRTVLDAGVARAAAAAASARPPVAHPLDPTLRSKAKVWLRIGLSALATGVDRPRLRVVNFNVAPATNALTVTNEVLGRGDGRPGQTFTLAHTNVLEGSLDVAVRESSDPAAPLVTWEAVRSLDAAGPFDSLVAVDWEAGRLAFGDGNFGRIVPLVAQAGEVIARSYRHGGGRAGEIGVRAIESLETGAPGVANAVNFVPGRGGRDTETLEQAKLRARRELSTRTRAVTAGDFEWIAMRTKDVRMGRAHVIPVRRPLDPSSDSPPVPSAPRCGPPLATGASGVDTRSAPGAVTVVAVPDLDVAEPIPTRSFLRAVCKQLDAHRLVTTEVHVVPPQYCRVCKVLVSVRARAGYSRATLQPLVEKSIGTFLHVLRGGEDGGGFPFGARLHVADVVSMVTRTEGVDRVESFSAAFTRTKSNATPREGQLVQCPEGADQTDHVDLGPDENVSVDVTSIAVSTV